MPDEDDASATLPIEDDRPPLLRLARSLSELDLLRLFGDFVATEGGSLASQEHLATFLDNAAKLLREPRPTAVHGLRTEAMFAYVAASLGECTTVMSLDGGLFVADRIDLRRPDYLVITRSSGRFLVEVKNHSPQDGVAPLELRADYLAGLKECARRLGVDLKLAVYWRRMSMWTLVDARHLDRVGGQGSLSFSAAVMRNEMAVLGDRVVCTVPPLALRVYTDPSAPRRVADDGSAGITIGRVALSAAGHDIQDPLERAIASFLLMHGGWSRSERNAEVHDGDLIWFEVAVRPEEEVEAAAEADGEFPPMVGTLSQMISAKYRELTAPDGGVALLNPAAEPGSLGVVIPRDYRGKVLKLWLLEVRPNLDGLERP